MALLRKREPGSSSLGYVWATARSVVEVAEEHLAELLAIKDAGFSVVEPAVEEDPVEELTEVAPEPAAPVTEPAAPVAEPAPTKAPARKATARKATTPKP